MEIHPFCPPRRRFIRSIAAAGAAALLPSSSLLAQASAVRERTLIDVHHHVMPPAFVKATQGRFVNPAVVNQWSIERALAEMDANGVAMAFSSITQPGVWFGDHDTGRALARECNEYMTRIARDHTGRLGTFAVLPLPDQDGSLRELEYCLDTLKVDGLGLLTSYGNKWLGDDAFMPVLEELNRRRAVVYVHPNAPECCLKLSPVVTPNMVEYPHDTTRAITSLLFSGALGRLRDIRFIFSHGGGTLPMLAGRITQLANPRDLEKVPAGVETELRRLYYEIANTAHRPAIAALTQVAPLSQILFGTDYPFVPIRSTAEGMTRVGLDNRAISAIAHENASALLPRAAARIKQLGRGSG